MIADEGQLLRSTLCVKSCSAGSHDATSSQADFNSLPFVGISQKHVSFRKMNKAMEKTAKYFVGKSINCALPAG